MTDREKAIETLLERIARLGNEPELGNSDGNVLAQQALAILREKPCTDKPESQEPVSEFVSLLRVFIGNTPSPYCYTAQLEQRALEACDRLEAETEAKIEALKT